MLPSQFLLKKNRLMLLFLFILILVTYTNSLNNAFLSDDLAEIVQNPNIGNLSNISNHLSGAIRLILYWFAFHLGGLNPIVFRLINIFFHTGSVFLIFTILKFLYSKKIAFFAAAVFAIHPAISEAVVWISGGMYAQYSFFFLLSLALYIFSKENEHLPAASSGVSRTRIGAEQVLSPVHPRNKLRGILRQNNKYYIASVISYWFSLMSHPQMPLALFLIFPLWEFVAGNLKKNWPRAVPFLLISLVYLLISLSSLPERTNTLQSVHYMQKGIDNPLLLVTIALTSYFELIFFPKTLTLYHSELAFGPIQFILRLLITLIFFAGILIAFKKNKTIFFWSSFFLIALSPTLTPFRLNWVVAERYLYLPIIGILVPVALGLTRLSRIPKIKQIIYILFAGVIILLSARTFIRNIDWKNEDNLWIATGKTSPSSPNTHNNLGDVYGRQGNKEAALKAFQKAIELKPDYGDAYHNLANTYLELKQTDKALENYQNALKFNPSLWQSYQNIAAIYYEQKKYDLTIDYLQKAILINPNNLNLKLNLGIVYLNADAKDKAKEVFNQILSADPNNPMAKQGLIEADK